MKILCHGFSCALEHITSGWKNVLEHCGHQWLYWPKGTSAFDVFYEYEPDIFIGTTYDLDRAICKNIAMRPEMKVILKGNNWGELTDEIDLKEFPIGNSTEEEQKRVIDLCYDTKRDLTSENPIKLFNFYHQNRMNDTMGLWEMNGVETMSMLPAADTYVYYPEEVSEEFKCDVGFVGGYWDYKGRTLNEFFLPLCYPVGKYKVKIFGNQIWPVVQYLGQTSNDNVRHLFNSATVCPNVSEPHATKFGFEVNERVFKIAACKGLCISDNVASLYEDIFINNELPIFGTQAELLDSVSAWVENPEHALRQEKIDKLYESTIRNHTYFDRMSAMCKTFQLYDEAKEIEELKERELLCKN